MLTMIIQFVIIKKNHTNALQVAEMKFKIPTVPATTNKCIRFPNDVLERIEQAITGKQTTFSAFVVQAVRDALDSLEEDDDQTI